MKIARQFIAGQGHPMIRALAGRLMSKSNAKPKAQGTSRVSKPHKSVANSMQQSDSHFEDECHLIPIPTAPFRLALPAAFY